MNKAHRDRIAFMRICSGKFDAGMEVYHVQGDRKQRLSQPQQMMASERQMIVDEAYAGDIIGVFDPGIFSIGDTICMPGKKFCYEGIPTFAPEHFARVRQLDTMKRKQFIKGISEIAQEGAIQIFQEYNTGMEEIIVGVVGVLQFDVLKYRLENEYKVDIRLRGAAIRIYPLDRERGHRSEPPCRHIRYEEDPRPQGPPAAPLHQQLVGRHGVGSKRRTGAVGVWALAVSKLHPEKTDRANEFPRATRQVVKLA